MDPIKLTFTPPSAKKLSSVYIVDDSPAERSMLADYFSKYEGLSVREFATGDECVKELVMSGEVPNIITMDYLRVRRGVLLLRIFLTHFTQCHHFRTHEHVPPDGCAIR